MPDRNASQLADPQPERIGLVAKALRSALVVPGLIVALWASYFLVALSAVQTSSAARSVTGLYPLDPTFADIHAVLAAIKCAGEGFNTYVTNPCDHFGRPHVYGSLWLALAGSGVGDWPLDLVGAATDLVFGSAVLLLLFRAGIHRWREALMWLAFLASPAVLLGLERANNDLLIFALVVALALLIEAGTPRKLVLAFLVTTLCALLKFYPLVLFLLPLIVPIDRLRGPATAAIYGVLSLCVIALTAHDMQKAMAVIPEPGGIWAMGGYLVFMPYLRPVLAKLLSVAMGAFIVASCFGWKALRIARSAGPAAPPSGGVSFADVSFALGALVLIFTFIVSAGYPYRWIFTLMVLPGLTSVMSEQSQASRDGAIRRASAGMAIAAALFVMWYLVINQIGVRLIPLWPHMTKLKELASWLFIACLAHELACRFADRAPAMAIVRGLIGPLRFQRAPGQ